MFNAYTIGQMAVRGAAKLDKLCRTVMLISYAVLLAYKIDIHFSADGGNKFYEVQNGNSTMYVGPRAPPGLSGGPYNPQDYPGMKVSMAVGLFSAYIYVYYFLMVSYFICRRCD